MTVMRDELTGYSVGYDEPVLYDAAVPFAASGASDTALRLYDGIGSAMRVGQQDLGLPLLAWLDGPAVLLDDVEQLVRDQPTRPGWSMLFDPATAPAVALPWLAQLVGERLERGAPEAQIRAQIAGRGRWRRGTAQAITAAVAATLTGTRTVQIRERADIRSRPAPDEPYRFLVLVDKAETPNPTATARALAAATPAGLVSALQVLAGRYADTYTDAYL